MILCWFARHSASQRCNKPLSTRAWIKTSKPIINAFLFFSKHKTKLFILTIFNGTFMCNLLVLCNSFMVVGQIDVCAGIACWGKQEQYLVAISAFLSLRKHAKYILIYTIYAYAKEIMSKFLKKFRHDFFHVWALGFNTENLVLTKNWESHLARL